MKKFLLGAAKALVAGIATGGAALLIAVGASEMVVLPLWAVLTPLFVYIVPNLKQEG